MWNTFNTETLGGIVAGVSLQAGGQGDQIHTYIARPDGSGPYPGIVLTHHAPRLGRVLPRVRSPLRRTRLHRRRTEPLRALRSRHTRRRRRRRTRRRRRLR